MTGKDEGWQKKKEAQDDEDETWRQTAGERWLARGENSLFREVCLLSSGCLWSFFHIEIAKWLYHISAQLCNTHSDPFRYSPFAEDDDDAWRPEVLLPSTAEDRGQAVDSVRAASAPREIRVDGTHRLFDGRYVYICARAWHISICVYEHPHTHTYARNIYIYTYDCT